MNPLKSFNPLLVLPVVIITTLGLAVLFSTSASLAFDQAQFLLIGIILFGAISFLDLDLLDKFSLPIFLVCLVINILPLFIGSEIRGSRRWIQIGDFGFQTSEVLKLGFAVFLSSNLSRLNINKPSLKLFFFIILTLISLVIVFLEPDLGTTGILFLSLLALVIFKGLSFKRLALFILLILLLVAPLWTFLKDYQKSRIVGFLNPQEDLSGTGYNTYQSIIAVGSGGLLGRGYGRGSQSHLSFLPEYHTDFVFASFAEEWGFIFCLLVLACFAILFLTMLKIAQKAKYSFYSLLAFSCFILLFLQTYINVSMNLGLFPVTGVPLPFMSYGGSSLITSFCLLGLVNNCYKKETGG